MLTPLQRKFKDSLIRNWAAGMVARAKIGKFSGGAYAPGTVANADSQGKGIPRMTVKGQKCVYLVEDAAHWIASRLETPDCKCSTTMDIIEDNDESNKSKTISGSKSFDDFSDFLAINKSARADNAKIGGSYE